MLLLVMFLFSLYVNDIIITGDDLDSIVVLKLALACQFTMKNLGPLYYFLHIEVAFSPKADLLFQSKYIVEIFDRAHLSSKIFMDTSIETNAQYASSDGSPLPDPSLYHTVVNNLVCLTITLLYIVYIVRQFITSPTTIHW